MKYLFTAAALVGSMACADSTAPAALRVASGHRDMDANETTPAALETVNPCNGDAVSLTGTLHFIIHSTTSTDGNQHFYIDFSSTYSGIGVPSGVSYTATTHQAEELTTNDPFPVVAKEVITEHLRSQTSVDNFDMDDEYHVTINSNGVITAVVDNQSNKCTG
jgi:hypothetical protein